MLDQLPAPEVLITHESDLDGLLSGLLLQRLARKIFQREVPLQAFHNNIWRQRAMNEKSAWVADMTFEARLDKPGWLIIDHHVTDAKPRHAQLVHDPQKSAALLCYELCRQHDLGSPALDRLVHLNNVSDLFLEDDPEFLLANDYAHLVKTYSFWDLHALIEGDPERLLDHPLLEVMAVKRRIEDPLGFAWSRDHVQAISPQVGFVETVLGNNNLIVHQLLETKATRYPVLITLFRRGNGTVLVSLRSRTGDALKVAQQLQGGGHPNAAGTTLPRSVQSIPEALTYLRQVLNPVPPAPASINTLGSLLDGLQLPSHER